MLGSAGTTGSDDVDLPEFDLGEAFTTGCGSTVRLPAFLHGTTWNRKRGGGKSERGLMLGVRVGFPSGGSPFEGLVNGFWVIDGADLETYFTIEGILGGDSCSHDNY